MRIGVDIVEINRIEKLAESQKFLQRIYTDEELLLVQGVTGHRKAEILAGRFAVKEAVAKALGTGISRGVSFSNVSTVRGEEGEPLVYLTGQAKVIADQFGVSAIRVSLSHAAGLVTAFVLLE